MLPVGGQAAYLHDAGGDVDVALSEDSTLEYHVDGRQEDWDGGRERVGMC